MILDKFQRAAAKDSSGVVRFAEHVAVLVVGVADGGAVGISDRFDPVGVVIGVDGLLFLSVLLSWPSRHDHRSAK